MSAVAETSARRKSIVDKRLLDKVQRTLTKRNPELVLEAFNNDNARAELKKLAKEMHPEIRNENIEVLMSEIVGMGFVERILEKEPEATDIRYNGSHVTVKTNKRKYIYEDEDIQEHDVVTLAKRFANATGKDFNEQDSRLNAQFEYMRVNAVHRRNAPYGMTMAIRISKPKLVVTESNFNTLADEYILDLCKLSMQSGSNIIMSGIPGSGKTELTKTLISFLDFKDAIITIEDTPEGHFKRLYPHLDITSWYTGNNLSESELIDEALRNDCDWLFVTETRTAQAANALFKGFLTGAFGVTSLHSGSAKGIPNRYYNMIKTELPIDEKAFYDDFYGTVNLGFHQVRRWINGEIVRYIDEIVEFTKDGQANTIYERWEEDGLFYSHVPNPLSKDFQDRLITNCRSGVDALRGTGLLTE